MLKKLIGLVALLILLWYCACAHHAPKIEQLVRDQTQTALGGSGFEGITAGVDGRDVTLTGTVDSEDSRNRLLSLIGGLPGVRVVLDKLSIAAPPQDASLNFSVEDGRVTISGVVPDEATKSGILAKAAELWGADNVVDNVTVDADVLAGSCWPGNWDDFLMATHGRGADVSVDIEGCKARVTGEVVSELERDRVLGAIGTALPGFEIIDGLTIAVGDSEGDQLQASLDEELRGKIIEFETDSARLTARGRAILDQVVGILKRYDGDVTLGGHTDSRNSDAYNQGLSERRAESAKRYLVGNGINAGRLHPQGFGEAQPIADNSTPEGMQRNRRTEIRVRNMS